MSSMRMTSTVKQKTRNMNMRANLRMKVRTKTTLIFKSGKKTNTSNRPGRQMMGVR